MANGNQNQNLVPFSYEEWTPAEREFANCMRSGSSCVLGDKIPNAVTAENAIRGEVIRFFALGGNKEYPIQGDKIILQGAWVSTELFLALTEIPFILAFYDCHFDGAVEMRNLHCQRLVLARSKFVNGFNGTAMQIKDNLNCSGSTFQKNSSGDAFNAHNMKVGGYVTMNENFYAEGEVVLQGATIGGELMCSGSTFKNPHGFAISATNMRVGRSIHMNDGFSAEGKVSLQRAKIADDLVCAGGKFRNSTGYAMDASGVQVGDSVFMGFSFIAEGEVRLYRAKIDGDLNCAGGKFHPFSGYSIAAPKMQIGGSVFMNEIFCANGAVVLEDSKIANDLDWSGGNFQTGGEKQTAINASGIQVDGHLLMTTEMTVTGAVDLRYAKARIVVDRSETRENIKFKLVGFTYESLHRDVNDVESRIKWLNNRPDGIPFSPQPYEQAAKVFFAMGRGSTARKILLAKELESLKANSRWKKLFQWWGKLSGLWNRLPQWSKKPFQVVKRISQWIWFGLLALVYGMGKTILASAVIIAVGWWAFHKADQAGYMGPHSDLILADCDYRVLVSDPKSVSPIVCKEKTKLMPQSKRPTEAVATLFPDYPKFAPFMYSVDVFFPFFAMHQEPFWYPQDPDGGANWVTIWYWIQIALGWIFTSIFLLAITDRLRSK